MRSRLLTLLLVAALASVALPSGAAAQTADYDSPPPSECVNADLPPNGENLGAVRAATLCLVNAERLSRGLGRLAPVAALDAVARAYAQRMVRQRFFEHTSPDGGTFLARIKRTTYLRGALRRWSVGENLAWGTGRRATPQEIVKAWMGSPGHRANILNRSFNELGLGVSPGAPQAGVSGDAATYVNEFGERRR